MFFDQVITRSLETENRHLVAPFHNRPASLSCKQVNICWHELSFVPGTSIFPTPLQPFHELSFQLFCFCIPDMRGLLYRRVAKAHQNRHMRVFIRERYRDLVSLHFVSVRSEIIEKCLQVGASYRHGQHVARSLVFTLPFLDHTLAGHL